MIKHNLTPTENPVALKIMSFSSLKRHHCKVLKSAIVLDPIVLDSLLRLERISYFHSKTCLVTVSSYR